MDTNAEYFDWLCRTCMNKVEVSPHDGSTIPPQQWLSIFDIIEECGALRIAELLSDVVPQIVVQPSDQLPKKICSECLQQLLSFYWFQKMCVQSDKEMHELISKEQIVLKTTILEEKIKFETERNDADLQPLKDLAWSSTLQNLQQTSIQEPLPDVTAPTIEPDAVQSSAEHLQDNTQLLDHCNDTQGEFEECIKNEPIEDDAVNTGYSDGDTIHSTISIIKDELIESDDQQLNDSILAEQRTTHAEDKPYECPYCPLRFSAKKYASKHKTIHEGIKPHMCIICGKKFRLKQYLTKHERIHSKEKPHKCDICEKNILAEQRTTQTEDKPYECPYCPLRFNSKSGVSMHKAIHEEAERHECDICGKDFKTRACLITHKRNHTEEKPHKCDFCEKRFTHMQQLKVHIRTHTREKPFKCKYCERGFAERSTLRYHLRRHLGKNIHRCKFCPLAFPSSAERRLHLTSHTNEDPEVHEQNLKALQEEEAKLVVKFSKENDNKIKQPSTDIPEERGTTYAKDKPYECPYCPLRFSSRSEVSAHKTIHEGIKPHKCSICGKKFRRKYDLAIHKRVHSKEKPYKCDLCEKRFARTHPLKVHIRTHTGERPYKCKYCELRFISNSSIHIHLRSHLGINIHRCTFCPLAFPSSLEMRLHLTSHKNEDPETRERNLKALQEEEVKLKLKFSKEKSKGQSTEEQQQQKLCNKEIEQQSTDIMADQHTTHSEDNTCGKKSRQKSDLMRHKRIHSKEKPHKCDLCEKRFIHMQSLKNHIRTHTGEKPYKCKYCEHAFSAFSTLHYHLRSHLGKNIHRCKFCPLGFPSYAEMRTHFTSHKREDPEVRWRNLKALQEEEAKLKLKFSKGKSKGQSREEQLQKKLCNKEIAQQSTGRGEFEEFIKEEPIQDYKSDKEYSDEDTMHSTISVTKDEAFPIESEDQLVNEMRDEFEEFIIIIE